MSDSDKAKIYAVSAELNKRRREIDAQIRLLQQEDAKICAELAPLWMRGNV